MKRYIVLTEDGSCGHMHRNYGRACDCHDRISACSIPATIATTTENLHPLWIDKQIGKIGMKRLKAILEA